jgi:hypothetical protein
MAPLDYPMTGDVVAKEASDQEQIPLSPAQLPSKSQQNTDFHAEQPPASPSQHNHNLSAQQQFDDKTQVEVPVLSSQTPMSPSQLLPNAANDNIPNPLLGANFDGTLYANALDFNRPESRGIDPEHNKRVPTGESVIDTAAVFDDSGRSFHGYKEGKYFLPNDGVLIPTSLP